LGAGTIYVEWETDGIQKIDLSTGVESTVMPENTSLHNYYISQDGKSMLASTDAPASDYDANLYTLTRLSDGTVILPADGRLYNVDQGADRNVVPVVPKGKTMVQAGDGRMFWR